MKKLLSVFMAASLLSACAAPIVKPEPVHGLLKGATDVSIRFQNDPARSGAGFNMQGHTIFSVPIVLAAASKMNSQSAEINATYAQYLKDHPEILSLKDTFNRELENNLLKRGLNITKVSAVKKVNEKKVISYDVNPAEIRTKWVVVIDGLIDQYFAPSSTDNYNPQSAALITVIDINNSSGKPVQMEQKDASQTGEGGPFSYKDFAALSNDPSRSYDGLQQSVIRLADQIAELLMDNETKH